MQVFLSHSTEDKDIVEAIGSWLINEKKLDVWIAQWRLTAGDSLVQRIGDGIKSSGKLVVFLTPASVISNWVNKEVAVGLVRQLAKDKGLGDKFVIPALLKKCDIPIMLSDELYANFTDKAFDDACEELYRGITDQPLGNQNKTFQNAFVKQYSVPPHSSGKHATVIEFGVKVSPSEGFIGHIKFDNKFSRFKEWSGTQGNPSPPQGAHPAVFMNVEVREYLDKTGFFKKFSSPNVSPRNSYYWYFESDEPLKVISATFLDFSGNKP